MKHGRIAAGTRASHGRGGQMFECGVEGALRVATAWRSSVPGWCGGKYREAEVWMRREEADSGHGSNESHCCRFACAHHGTMPKFKKSRSTDLYNTTCMPRYGHIWLECMPIHGTERARSLAPPATPSFRVQGIGFEGHNEPFGVVTHNENV
eukprot:356637-Chlamydomonas_euryale.AAC.2